MSKVAATNGTEPATPAKSSKAAGVVANWADERLGLGSAMKKNLRKVFPDHWSFMLGEVALWSFVVLLLSGVFLTLWFDPSMAEVQYNGSYSPLRGVHMSAAFASTLDISFDVRGGLLMRQMHHWAAMIFIASMMIHLLRVYLTGAFRKPREVNWLIGCLLLLLGTIEGFTGYSLPDDLLSGTGVRAADGFMKATPVVGTYMSFFLFGGEFPGDSIIPRFYVMHILLIPGLLLALIAAHMLLLVYHKHTQWPGPGRTQENVVGYPMLPVYMAKAGGFFFIVFGVTALMGGLFSINNVWKLGPYDPSKVTAGSQPDWYMGWPDGLLRIIPAWETHLWGHTVSWNVMLPILIAPPMFLVILMLLPFIESWVTGDKREHHLLQRPRNAPTRTAVMVALMTFYGLAWAAGGNDIIAIKLHLSINQITYFMRAAVFIGPVIAFFIARRWCISLQRHDEEKLLHGYESGVLVRSPQGGYAEKHLPLPEAKAYTLTARDRDPEVEEVDESLTGGKGRRARLRNRLQKLYFADNVQKPTADELHDAQHHAEHELHELEGQIAAGPNRHGPADH
ncbi:cytochrome bc complex cytochrome b subunit [Nocardioides sp. YIM 152588]|uniref:cytochrome bc1 complex cytochrome b subunit n=1 Tax=Nocardioides sp. YIM 152588 TaxID=3158259 RepID=UPI0032E43466